MPDPLDTSCVILNTSSPQQALTDEDETTVQWPLSEDVTARSHQLDRSRKSSQPDIFERSLSSLSFGSSRRNSRISTSTALNKLNARLNSVVSINSQRSVAFHHNTEDFIPPVLDHSAEILTNPLIDFSEVSVVCCDCEGEGIRVKTSAKPGCRARSCDGKPSSRPRQRSRSRSRSLICNSLLKALAQGEEEEESYLREDESDNVEECSSDSKTINFYSFNDILNREKDLEKFNTFRMSKLLS